jgi:hypothetical protein
MLLLYNIEEAFLFTAIVALRIVVVTPHELRTPSHLTFM